MSHEEKSRPSCFTTADQCRLQKSLRNYCSYVWTGAPSGMAFVPAQGLSGKESAQIQSIWFLNNSGRNYQPPDKHRVLSLQRSSLAINQRINKVITVTKVTYGNIWFYNKWIFQAFFLCSHRHGYKVECEIELLVHNTDCTLTIETTGQNPIHRSLKTCITGFYGCVSKYIYWI